MIIVSGTGRSGTSMWMQILAAAGVDIVGEQFPLDWGERIGAANPRGFYESALVEGINFSTNPSPYTGALLTPEESKTLAVKVFTRGLRKTERRFIGRVLVSVRHWQPYAASLARLWDLERSSGVRLPDTPSVHPSEYWLMEHLTTISDAWQRGYEIRLVSFESVVARPAEVVPDVLDWLQVAGDRAAAISAVQPILDHSGDLGLLPPGGPPPELLASLYEAVHHSQPIGPELLARLAGGANTS